MIFWVKTYLRVSYLEKSLTNFHPNIVDNAHWFGGGKQSLWLFNVVTFPWINAGMFRGRVERQKYPQDWPDHAQRSWTTTHHVQPSHVSKVGPYVPFRHTYAYCAYVVWKNSVRVRHASGKNAIVFKNHRHIQCWLLWTSVVSNLHTVHFRDYDEINVRQNYQNNVGYAYLTRTLHIRYRKK